MNISKLFALSLVIILSGISNAVLAQKKLKPGQSFSDCPTCPEMVIIPAGSFTIGSPDDEAGRTLDPEPVESPQKLVHIKQFAAGKFDITKEQWAAFLSRSV